MKGYVKVMIAGGIILAVGLIGLLALLGLNGWNFNPQWEMKTYECTETNGTLKLDYSIGEVKTQFYDGDVIVIEYPHSEKMKTEITEKDGVFSVVSGKRHWYDVTFWFNFNIPATTISLPRGTQINMDAVLNAGELNIAGGKYGEVSVKLNAGAANLGEIECATLECRINAGTVNSNRAVCRDLIAELNAGNAHFKTVECGNISIKLNAGNADLNVVGKKEDYNISVEKNAGSCNLNGQTGATNKRLVCKLNAGSLNVNFTD